MDNDWKPAEDKIPNEKLKPEKISGDEMDVRK